MKQTFRTTASIWTFDDESMMYLRTPIDDTMDHPSVAWSTIAEPFVSATIWPHNRVFVQRSDHMQDYLITGAIKDGTVFVNITEETAQ